MSDSTTIRVYDDRASDYAEMSDDATLTDPQLAGFIAACAPGGQVLDLGCGPGAAAAVMAQAGLNVIATDASGEMVALANQKPGVSARQETFDEISGHDVYDGIWASFSLLHAPRPAFPGYLAALNKALISGGVFYIGMKLGSGEARDSIGRQYTYYNSDELEKYMADAGFSVLGRKFGSGPGLDGSQSDWTVVAARG